MVKLSLAGREQVIGSDARYTLFLEALDVRAGLLKLLGDLMGLELLLGDLPGMDGRCPGVENELVLHLGAVDVDRQRDAAGNSQEAGE